jgi:hypothetical protein
VIRDEQAGRIVGWNQDRHPANAPAKLRQVGERLIGCGGVELPDHVLAPVS